MELFAIVAILTLAPVLMSIALGTRHTASVARKVSARDTARLAFAQKVVHEVETERKRRDALAVYAAREARRNRSSKILA